MRRLDLKKLKKSFHEIKFAPLAFISLALMSQNTQVFANPKNPTVIAGSATFHSPTDSTFQINAINNTIINWEDFSIDPGEMISFLLPESKHAILNRVTGNSFSEILGTLQSNGNVYLINPNGILIGNGAVINTGGFLASTLDVLDSDFLAGGDLQFIGSTKNGVINLGSIHSSAGDVVLLGYSIDNQGSITAPQGGAHLFAGSQLILQVNGPEKIVIQPKISDDLKDGTGIHNSGTINSIITELKVDGNPYLYGIHHEGQINATGIVTENGQVYLRAEKGSTVVSGQTTAINHDKTGGNITILGDHIAMAHHSLTDVSGDNGGGTVLIGGGFQGKDESLPNAKHVVIEDNATIKADAILAGDGGTIVQWSDDSLFHFGKASAKGGTYSGNGGMVEASGKVFLDYQGIADLTAPNGKTGTLLLDPSNITITNSATANIYPATFPAGVIPSPYPYWDVYAQPASNSVTFSNINITNLITAINNANVVIQTGIDNGIGAGDIIWIGQPITPGNKGNLTLNSVNNIIFQGDSSGSTGYASLVGDLNLFAQGDIILQGGSNTSAGTYINLINGTLNMKSIYGDINFLAGTGDGASVNIEATYINFEAPNGSFLMQGGSSPTGFNRNNVTLLCDKSLSISVGNDVSLIGGTGADSYINIIGILETNINSGGSCYLLAKSGPTFIINSSVSLMGGLVNCTIGNDLIMQGGSTARNSCVIESNNSDVNISIGHDLLMRSGSEDSTFVQIGTSNGQTGNSNITISHIGGNATLDASASTSNSYCAIGNGNMQNSSQGAPNGNIIVNGSPTAHLTLIGGGSFNNAFAQIGNFEGFFETPVPIEGNITVSNFGDINLTPNNSYASIGHGSTFTTYPSITGDINLYNNTGSINLNSGNADNTFAQIGHFSTAATTGNITVNTTGVINITGGNNAQSASIIGHGNRFNPNPSSYSGNISVSGDAINLTAGDNSFSDALIGFQIPAVTRGQISISSTSSIDVQATHNISLKAGDLGNAFIGHIAKTDSSSSSHISNITVTSNEGNIHLIGGVSIPIGFLAADPTLGSAYIGTTILFGSNFPTSNVQVNANNGTLKLSGFKTTNPNIATGFAGIISSSNQPYQTDLTISADNIILESGINDFLLGGGDVFISAGDNLNVTTKTDLLLNSSVSASYIYALGGVSSFDIGQDLILKGGSAGKAQIGFTNTSVPTSTTFSIGRDLQLIKNLQSNGLTQIGYSNLTNRSDIIFTNIGGNVLLDCGTEASSVALIGHGYGQIFSIDGDILFNKIGSNGFGGNLTLKGGSNLNSFAQIGHTGFNQLFTANITGDVRLNDVGGTVNLIGGSLTKSYALIGHGSTFNGLEDSTITGDIIVNASNVELQGGSGFASDAIIGFANSPDASNTIFNSQIFEVTSKGPISLTSGNDTNTVIGYYNTAGRNIDVQVDNINVTANGGNVSLTAGTKGPSNGGNAIIGLTSSSSTKSSIKVTTPFDVILKVPTGLTGTAKIVNSTSSTNSSGIVKIDPARIILLGGSGFSEILSSGNLELNFSDALNINYDATNPNTLQNERALVFAYGDVLINTSEPSYGNIVILGTNNDGSKDSGILAEGTIQIRTLTEFGAGDVFIGRADMKSPAEIFSFNEDVIATIEGELNIQGGSNGAVAFVEGYNVTINANDSIILNGNGSNAYISSNSSGDINLTTAKDFIGAGNGSITAQGGNISTIAVRDIILSGTFGFTSNGTSNILLQAGRNLSMSNNANIVLNSSGKLTMMASDLTLNNSSKVSVTGSGNLFMIGNRHIYLNDNSVVTTNGGNLQLVVDNDNMDPAFYGTGRIVKSAAALVNSNGGPTSIFTSRQPFNMISGTINGVPFVPGIQYENTAQEQWGTYYETAFNGRPFTVFYKDKGTPIFPPPGPPAHDVNALIVALSEALQEWKLLDQLYLVPVEFCNMEYIPDPWKGSGCTNVGGDAVCEGTAIILRREYVTYNTKMLLNMRPEDPFSF